MRESCLFPNQVFHVVLILFCPCPSPFRINAADCPCDMVDARVWMRHHFLIQQLLVQPFTRNIQTCLTCLCIWTERWRIQNCKTNTVTTCQIGCVGFSFGLKHLQAHKDTLPIAVSPSFLRQTVWILLKTYLQQYYVGPHMICDYLVILFACGLTSGKREMQNVKNATQKLLHPQASQNTPGCAM